MNTRTIHALAFSLAVSGLPLGALAAVPVSVQVSASATNTEPALTTSIDVGVPVSITTAADVSSEAELQAYEETIRAEDANIIEAHVDNPDRVEVEYMHHGDLFSIFPVEVKAETVVALDDTGTVEIHTSMPWWNLFVTGTDSVSATVDTRLKNESDISVSMKMSEQAAVRAQILETIAEAHAGASASVSVE